MKISDPVYKISLSITTPKEPDALTGYNCEFCKKDNVNSLCGRCKRVAYCDGICQKAHWAKHKLLCEKEMKPQIPFSLSEGKVDHDMNTLNYTTVFLRFPHLYIDMMKDPKDLKNPTKLLLLGPGLIIPKELGETQEGLKDEIYCPQLSELGFLYPKAKLTVMERAGKIFDLLVKAAQEGKLAYRKGLASQTLKKNNFFRNPEGYRKLEELINKAGNYPLSEIREGDIATQALSNEFNVIVATKVLMHAVSAAEDKCKNREERVAAAVNLLSNCFSGLKRNGKLFLDKESVDSFISLSNMNLTELLTRVKEKLQLKNDIKWELIPHDIKEKNSETGRYYLTSVACRTSCIVTDTDDIYKFTVPSALK